MYRPRIIPCLLLKDKGLVKSTRFKDFRYVGDPMNAVRIFNDKKADELIFLDIQATEQQREPSLELIERLGDECNMPFAVGGGIRDTKLIARILKAGAEKVSINAEAVLRPEFIKEAATTFGSSTIAVSIDVKKNIWGKEQVFIRNGKKGTGIAARDHARKMEDMGAGELIVNSIAHDGLMEGYHLELIKRISDAVDIPVIALGGAGTIDHFKEVLDEGNASAAAAGSYFVFHGRRKAVLINFPTQTELAENFAKKV